MSDDECVMEQKSIKNPPCGNISNIVPRLCLALQVLETSIFQVAIMEKLSKTFDLFIFRRYKESSDMWK